jgi:endogenous inhibitor of DNA gyrase (YacG/DUF329 family)
MNRPMSLCPACRKAVPTDDEVRPKTFPFCNDRCRLVDLGRWLDGEYVLPEPISPDDDEAIQKVLAARLGEG